MKKIYRFLLISVALLAFAPIVGAQTPTTINEACKDPLTNDAPEFPYETAEYTIKNNVGYKKQISKPQTDGTYWIKLEAFAAGSASVIESSKPSDVILVLDVSSSMDQNNYLYKGTSMKRWQALRAATLEFVQSIYDNAKQCRSVDNDYDGNRIAIVTYCRTAQVITGGWLDIEEVVSKDESTGTYSGSLINTINRNDTGGVWANYHGDIGTEPTKPSTSGTRPDRGLRLAIDQLLDGSPNQKREEANLTVLLFTDGYPTDEVGTGWGEPNQNQSKFDWVFANKALYYAGEVKTTYEASLYTVGLISTVPRPTSGDRTTNTGENYWKWRNYTRVLQLMKWMSSDYPDAAWSFSGVSPEDQNYDIDNPFNGTSSSNVHTGNAIPAIWRTEWKYNDGGNSGNDYITLDSFVAGDPNPDETAYSTVVSDNQSFDEIFEKISQQSGGTPVKLNSASSTVDIVSSSFKVPTGASSRGIKLFTAKCVNATSNPYTFEREYIKGESPNYTYNEDGTLSTTVKVDANLGVELSGNLIEVTGFEYSNNWCGTIKDASENVIGSRGYKVIILIPIKMNPDAVGGPNVETNAPGSGIYENYDPTDPENKPLVEFDPPTVSLPVNVYIEKVGLVGRESAKFRIEVAYLPASGDPEDVDEEDWEYVSTVFVTNSPYSDLSDDDNPMVKVKGMPATKMVDGVQKPLIYRITEEGWSWSYTPDETTYEHVQYTVTSKVDNPFTFENDKRTSENIDVKVRHAESKSTNIFTGTGVVQYDDSKANTGRESSGPAGLTTGGSN